MFLSPSDFNLLDKVLLSVLRDEAEESDGRESFRLPLLPVVDDALFCAIPETIK